MILSWQKVAGAKGYVLQVGTDGEWSDAPTAEFSTLATTFVLPAWLPHADYVWRVAARQEQGHGRWSATTSSTSFTRAWPDRPNPLTPSVDQAVSGVPTFTWTPVKAASEYQVQVSTSPVFDEQRRATVQPVTDNDPTQDQADPETTACFTTRTRVTPFTNQTKSPNAGAGDCDFRIFKNAGPFYWRVRALDHLAEEPKEVDTTPTVDEGIDHAPPEPEPVSLDPSACSTGVEATATPTATATASPTASASASPTTAPAEGGACDPSNAVEKGAWSASTRFTRSSSAGSEGDYRTLPTVSTSVVDEGLCDGSGVCKDFPTLAWSPVAGASSYRLYVALDAAYSNIQYIVETAASQWTPTDQWRDSTAGKSYFYVVQPCTTKGCGAVTPTPPSFRKSSTRVSLAAPANGALFSAGGVVLSWTDWAATFASAAGKPATSEAFAYRVQVAKADNPDFQTEQLVDETIVDATTYVSAVKDYGDGDFLWRVQALDASDHKLPWSAVRSFTRDSTPPSVLRVAPTSSVDPSGTIALRFNEAVTGVSATTVGIGVPATVAQPQPSLVTIKPSSPLALGASYRVSVAPAVTDAVGNAALPTLATVTTVAAADDAKKAFAYAGSWMLGRSSQANGGVFHSAARSAAVSVTTFGTGVVIGGCAGPSNGLMDVFVDGTRRARVDTYRSFAGCGMRLATVTGLTKGFHRVQIRPAGVKRPASKGTLIGFDGLRALP